MSDTERLITFLMENRISFDRFDHPAVYTVADVKRLVPKLSGAETKNLFFRDKKGNRHFLVVVPADLQIDIKALSGVLGTGHLSFGSPDRLMEHLGVEPGSVTLLAVFFDIFEFLRNLKESGNLHTEFKELPLKAADFAPCHLRSLGIGSLPLRCFDSYQGFKSITSRRIVVGWVGRLVSKKKIMRSLKRSEKILQRPLTA